MGDFSYVEALGAMEEKPKRVATEKNTAGWSPVTLITPGDTLALMNKVDTLIESLNNEILAFIQSGKAREVFVANWNIFRAEWKQFFTDHKGWWSRATATPYEMAENWEDRVTKWREAFAAEGGKFTGPGPEKPRGTFPWALVLGGVAIVGGIIGYVKYQDLIGASKTRSWQKAQDRYLAQRSSLADEERRLMKERMAMIRSKFGRSSLGV